MDINKGYMFSLVAEIGINCLLHWQSFNEDFFAIGLSSKSVLINSINGSKACHLKHDKAKHIDL